MDFDVARGQCGFEFIGIWYASNDNSTTLKLVEKKISKQLQRWLHGVAVGKSLNGRRN